MANDPKRPILGELAVDATHLAGRLIDLPPGGKQGLRTAQPGCDAVVAEILANQEMFGERAGITALKLQELRDANDIIAEIDVLLEPTRKLVEVLDESRAVFEDRRQRSVSSIAAVVETNARASGDTELLAKYEKARTYRSASARKGVRTRQRNQQGEIDAPEDTLGDTPENAIETPAQ